MEPLSGQDDPPQRVEASAAQAGHRPTEINALLGRGTRFEGKLYFEGRVRLDGDFQGEIRGDDVLVIGDGARVSGDILVGACIVTGGEVSASIRARTAIELYAPSKVTGALHAPAIFIDRGVQFDGTCKMAPLDEADTRTSKEASPPPSTPAPPTPASPAPPAGRE
jgi:cytoskeletal protein CcmA (bactofilin family)